MNKKVFMAVTLFIFFAFVLYSNVLAWDDKVTHKDLSEYAAESSALSKDKGDYLKLIGFNNNLDEYLIWGNDKKKIRDWLRKGAELEDSATTLELVCGNARSYNHFHNPLKTWDSAGLDDYVLNLCPPPLIPPVRHATGESSLLWMQDGTEQAGYSTEGDWSWNKVRQVYYWALISTTESLRQINFAQTFKGLGHQIHLIQDAAQPDHVRNDAHPFTRNKVGGLTIEAWAAKGLIL